MNPLRTRSYSCPDENALIILKEKNTSKSFSRYGLTTFPSEVTILILKFLDPQSRMDAAKVCTRFKAQILELGDFTYLQWTSRLVNQQGKSLKTLRNEEEKIFMNKIFRIWFHIFRGQLQIDKKMLLRTNNYLALVCKCSKSTMCSNLFDFNALLGFYIYKNVKRAWKFLKLGKPKALTTLGNRYLEGQDVEKNDAKAFFYYDLAAKEGDAHAWHKMGLCYELSRGVNEDMVKALKCFEVAASKGHFHSWSKIGLAYEYGNGTKQNISKAKECYQRGLNEGCSLSQYNLGWHYEKKQKFEQAADCYMLAAAQELAIAELQLGKLYFSGKGVEKNPKTGAEYIKKAADQGEGEAQYHLGHLYLIGEQVEQDLSQAIHYFKLASNQNINDAKDSLGICYEKVKQS